MVTQSRKIFIDSSILVSFVNRADPNHLKGVHSIETIAKLKFHAYTSNQIISDTYATLTRQVGISVALDFLQAILQSDIEIIFSQRTDLIAAYRLLQTNRERQVSFREALSAIAMRKKGIIQILIFASWHNLLGTYVSNLVTV